MKYWDELNRLETSLIEMELIKSNLRVVTNGAECSHTEDLLSALEAVTSSFEDKIEEVSVNFQCLFETVRADRSEKRTTDYVQPSEGALELDRIVRGWSKA